MSKNTAPRFLFNRDTTSRLLDSPESILFMNGQANNALQVFTTTTGSLLYYDSNGALIKHIFLPKSYLNVGGDSIVTQQPDGKFLTVIARFIGPVSSGPSNPPTDIAVLRYTAVGILDTQFSGDGEIVIHLGEHSKPSDVVVQIDKKILVVGNTNQFFPDNDIFLVRYNANGSLDTSFSKDGKVVTHIGLENQASSMTTQADGKILVAGTSDGNCALVRYNTDGSLDTHFSGDGKVIADLGSSSDSANLTTVQADGKILVSAQSNDNFVLLRYNMDGSLDAHFSGDGKVITDLGWFTGLVTVQPDGKILLVGNAAGSINYERSVLVRYNANGTLDTSFSGDGKLITLNNGSGQSRYVD